MDYDKILINQSLLGNKQSFGLLVEKYQNKVFSICLGFMKNNADAQDMTQEVFIKAFRKLDYYRFECKFYSWLYKIAMGTCLDQLRKKQKISYIDIDNDTYDKKTVINDNNLSPNKIILQNELINYVNEGIYKLNPTDQKIMRKRLFEDRKFEEIAQSTGINSSTVRTKFYRGLKHIKEVINNYKEDE